MARRITDELDLLQPTIHHSKSPMNFKALKRRCASKRVQVDFDEIMAEIVTMLRYENHVKSVSRDGHKVVVTWKHALSAHQIWRAERRLSEAVDLVYGAYDRKLRLHS